MAPKTASGAAPGRRYLFAFLFSCAGLLMLGAAVVDVRMLSNSADGSLRAETEAATETAHEAGAATTADAAAAARAGAAATGKPGEPAMADSSSKPLFLQALLARSRVPLGGDSGEAKGADPCEADPLDGDCRLTGYPEKALDVDEVRLCDPTLHAMLRHSRSEMLCEKDATCVACRPHYMRTKKRIAAFRDQELQARRAEVFAERFGSPSSRGIVVLGMNYGQVYLFANWVCSLHEIGLDPRSFTYVIVTDESARAAVEQMGFVVEPLAWLAKAGDGIISERYSGLANVGPHADINTMVLSGVEAVLLAGYPALLMDVDIVWKRDALAYLQSASFHGRDVIGSFSPRNDAYGFVNGGAVYFQPTRHARIFVQSMVNVCAVKRGSDQVVLNAMLRFYRFKQLGLAIVPMHVFNTHWSKHGVKNTLPGQQPYLLHTVGLFKADRLMVIDMWFLTPQCPWHNETFLEQPLSNGLVNATLHKRIGARAVARAEAKAKAKAKSQGKS